MLISVGVLLLRLLRLEMLATGKLDRRVLASARVSMLVTGAATGMWDSILIFAGVLLLRLSLSTSATAVIQECELKLVDPEELILYLCLTNESCSQGV